MIFSVFIFLFALAIIFIGLGYAVDIPILSIVGVLFIIGLGGIMLSSDVEIKTGENVSNTIDANGTITSQTITDVYEPYDFGKIGKSSFGIATLLLGIGLFVVVVATAGD